MKNVSRSNLWAKAEKSHLHYKLYKSGKNWITTSLFMLSIGTFLISGSNEVSANASQSVSGSQESQTATGGQRSKSATIVTTTKGNAGNVVATDNSYAAENTVANTSSKVSDSSAAQSSVSATSQNSTAMSNAASTYTRSAASKQLAAANSSSGATTSAANSSVNSSAATSTNSSVATSSATSSINSSAATSTNGSAATSSTNTSSVSPANSSTTSSVTSPASPSKVTSSVVAKTSKTIATSSAGTAEKTSSNVNTSVKGVTVIDNTATKNSTNSQTAVNATSLSAAASSASASGIAASSAAGQTTADKTNKIELVNPTDAELTAAKKAASAAFAKTGVAQTIVLMDAADANATDPDTSSYSYKAGQTQANADLSNAANNVGAIADVVDQYRKDPSMIGPDGKPVWTGVANKVFNAHYPKDGDSVYYEGSIFAPSYFKNHYVIYHTSDNVGKVNMTDFVAGYAKILSQYAGQLKNYIDQVATKAQDPSIGDQFVNSTPYDPNDLKGSSNLISNIISTIQKAGGIASDTIWNAVRGLLGLKSKDVVSQNPDIFNFTPATGLDDGVATSVNTTITTLNRFIVLVLPTIQNAISNQALNDIRSLGGAQVGAITLPDTLASDTSAGKMGALGLNDPLKNLATAFGLAGSADSATANDIYRGIAAGIKTDIIRNFQKGMDIAIAQASNPSANIKTPNFASVSGFDASDPTKAANTKQSGSTTAFMESVGYSWGNRLASSIIGVAATDLSKGTNADSATLISELKAQGIITQAEYDELVSNKTNADKNYTATGTGSINTIYTLYQAEQQAIQKAQIAYQKDPTQNVTSASTTVQFTNPGIPAGTNDPTANVNMEDYSDTYNYLKSTDAVHSAMAAADVQSHTNATTKTSAGNVAHITASSALPGDETILSKQLKQNGVIDYLNKAAGATYVSAYNVEADKANKAYQAGITEFNNQTKSDNFNRYGILDGPDKTSDPNMSGTSDGTASMYKEGDKITSGQAFTDGFDSQGVVAITVNTAAATGQTGFTTKQSTMYGVSGKLMTVTAPTVNGWTPDKSSITNAYKADSTVTFTYSKADSRPTVTASTTDDVNVVYDGKTNDLSNGSTVNVKITNSKDGSTVATIALTPDDYSVVSGTSATDSGTYKGAVGLTAAGI